MGFAQKILGGHRPPLQLGCATVGALYERPRCIFCAKPPCAKKAAARQVPELLARQMVLISRFTFQTREEKNMTDITRRNFLMSSAFAFVALRMSIQQTPPASAGPADPMLIEDLVAAYRILAQQGVGDGYGHVSDPHELKPNLIIMSH